MRFASFAALVALNGVDAKVSIAKLPSELTPEHAEAVGQAHTDAFEMLRDMYSDHKPLSKMEMMKDLGEIMASFCDDETRKEECMKKARGHGDLDSTSDVIYPDNIDAKLLVKIDDVYTTLNTLQDDNVSDILDKLEAIKEEIKVMDIDPIHRHAALSGAAVAVESTKLWTSVYADAKHPLYGLHHSTYFMPKESAKISLGEGKAELDPMHGHHRRLSNNCYPPVPVTYPPHSHDYYTDNWVWIPGWGWVWLPFGNIGGGSNTVLPFLSDRFKIIDIIQADIDGAFFNVFQEADNNPVVVINPSLLFETAFVGATSRSATWAENPPTVTPTATPSLAPSISCNPTKAPSISAAPSTNPSLSMAPSVSPTSAPSVSPTSAPSVSPTSAPSVSPTSAPQIILVSPPPK